MKKTAFSAAGAVLLTASVLGQTRVSSSYTMIAESLDGGGTRAAAVGYSMQGSISGFGEVATAPALAGSLKPGFVGQIYDVATLQLTAAPAVVTEGGTSQLSATAVLDDASLLEVSSSNVAWRALHGPIANTTTSGLFTLGSVFETTLATVRGDYLLKAGTLDLTVLNVGLDDHGLYANDGIPDTWQVDYFGPDHPDGAALSDPDGDGQPNHAEALAGTSPVDHNSKFRFEVGSHVGVHQSVSFSPRLSTRSYSVDYTTDLGRAPFVPLASQIQTDQGFTRTIIDTNAVGGARFYRVRINLP